MYENVNQSICVYVVFSNEITLLCDEDEQLDERDAQCTKRVMQANWAG